MQAKFCWSVWIKQTVAIVLLIVNPMAGVSDTLTIGGTPAFSVLPLVAKEEGIYQRHLVTVEHKKFQSGKLVMDAILAGSVEVGTIIDTNLAYLNFLPNDLIAFASLGYKVGDAIYFRKDSGIVHPKDLAGKRIGYVPATAAHVFLARFLARHDVLWGDVRHVTLQPPAMEIALGQSAVDAVTIWQPWGLGIERSLPNNVGRFLNSDDLYPSQILLAATKKTIEQKPEAIAKFLAALGEAQMLFSKDPQRSYPYLSREIGAPPEKMAQALEGYRFKVDSAKSVLPLVREIGTWIKESDASFRYQTTPRYETAFDDRFFSASPAPAQREKVTFCRPSNMYSALLFIAESRGYFKDQGINPHFQPALNGKICQDMLVARGADYAVGAEGPFVYLATHQAPVRLLATIQQNPEVAIFARRDRGVNAFADLRGKRIGYLPGSVSFFFLGRILKHYGIAHSEVTLLPMQPPTMPAALQNGAVDAFSMWEPWGAQAKQRDPTQFVSLTAMELYRSEGLLTTHIEAIRSNPAIPDKVLRALLQAEEFIEANGEDAFAILSKAIAFEPTALKQLWPQYVHRVELVERSFTLMEDNFSLVRESDPNFKGVSTPTFTSFVESSYLKQLRPERVSY